MRFLRRREGGGTSCSCWLQKEEEVVVRWSQPKLCGLICLQKALLLLLLFPLPHLRSVFLPLFRRPYLFPLLPYSSPVTHSRSRPAYVQRRGEAGLIPLPPTYTPPPCRPTDRCDVVRGGPIRKKEWVTYLSPLPSFLRRPPPPLCW